MRRKLFPTPSIFCLYLAGKECGPPAFYSTAHTFIYDFHKKQIAFAIMPFAIMPLRSKMDESFVVIVIIVVVVIIVVIIIVIIVVILVIIVVIVLFFSTSAWISLLVWNMMLIFCFVILFPFCRST